MLVGCGDRGATWERIERDGVLRIGLDPSYPPFESLEGEQLVGIDVELVEAISAEYGLTPHFDWIGYDGLYDALFTGRVDALVSALIVDETRTKEFSYSQPYFNAGQVLVVPAGSAIRSTDDLDGGTVAVELGAEGHVVATQLRRLDLQIMTLETAEAALQAVLKNEVDATLTDSISTALFTAQNPDLTVADEAVTVEPYAIVVRAADGVLLQKIDEALQLLEQSGELDAIMAENMGN